MNATSIILGAILSALFLSVLVLFHETSYVFEKMLVSESVEAARHNFNRSLIEKGIVPEKRSEHLFKAAKMLEGMSTKIAEGPRAKGSLLIDTISSSADEETMLALGLVIRSETTELSPYNQSTLNAPSIRLSGALDASWFGLKNLVVPAEKNPSGSYYRFSTDRTEPSEDSPVWGNEEFTPENMPKHFSVKCFHADRIYDPSESTSATFEMPAPEILLLREDGSAKHGVSYWEIKNDFNRLILTTRTKQTLYNIEYSIDEGKTWKQFSGAFHVGFSNWGINGAKIDIKITPKSPHFDDVFYSYIFLHSVKSKLLPPKISPENGADLYPGLEVAITNTNEDKNEFYGKTEYTQSGERFAAQITIKTEP